MTDSAAMTGDPRYQVSEAMLRQALEVIPLGSQTFSKSKTHYPLGVSPYFAERGKGSRLWDVDGNEYIDFINSLAAINLGYGDAEVDGAVRAQLDKGVVFSLSHGLEREVAELLVEMVPCAELVRFGKNGSDATAGAIRVARAFTGRDRVAACGYHGWQDWYIGATTRNRGVPKATSDLTHLFPYNDLAALDATLRAHPGEFAAVIMEPMNVAAPAPGYLAGVKEIAHRHGALLIFDETITGFRFAPGGAQEKFSVTPDLATFGKGMANGYPLSAVAGRADVMRLMEEIFYSFTFGGETLSLAAAKATMLKLRREDACGHYQRQGSRLMRDVDALIARHGLGQVLRQAGDPSWSFLIIGDAPAYSQWEIKTLFLQEVFARGILTLGTHNLSLSHSDADIARLLKVYDEVFAILADVLQNRSLKQYLRCAVLQPLFKVR